MSDQQREQEKQEQEQKEKDEILQEQVSPLVDEEGKTSYLSVDPVLYNEANSNPILLYSPPTPTKLFPAEDDKQGSVESELADDIQHMLFTLPSIPDSSDEHDKLSLTIETDVKAHKLCSSSVVEQQQPSKIVPPPPPSHLVKQKATSSSVVDNVTVPPPIPRAIMAQKRNWSFLFRDDSPTDITIRLNNDLSSLLLNLHHMYAKVIAHTSNILVDQNTAQDFLQKIKSNNEDQEIIVSVDSTASGRMVFGVIDVPPANQEVRLFVKANNMLCTDSTVDIVLSTPSNNLPGFCELCNRNEAGTSAPLIVLSSGTFMEKVLKPKGDTRLMLYENRLLAFESTIQVTRLQEENSAALLKSKDENDPIVTLSGSGKIYISA